MLPIDSAERKRIPIHSGVFAYFPDALIEVAKVSYEGNEKHNPGLPLHWSRGKSDDHEDCIARHTFDIIQTTARQERINHMRNRAWRSLAALQIEIESEAKGLYVFRPDPGVTIAELARQHMDDLERMQAAMRLADGSGPAPQCDDEELGWTITNDVPAPADAFVGLGVIT